MTELTRDFSRARDSAGRCRCATNKGRATNAQRELLKDHRCACGIQEPHVHCATCGHVLVVGSHHGWGGIRKVENQ